MSVISERAPSHAVQVRIMVAALQRLDKAGSSDLPAAEDVTKCHVTEQGCIAGILCSPDSTSRINALIPGAYVLLQRFSLELVVLQCTHQL